MSVIDIHAHYFPPRFVEAFERHGGRRAWPEHPDGLDHRSEENEQAGIDLQVIGLGHNQPYFERPADADACARLANDLYAEATVDARGLGAFGAVPLPHVELALSEAARCLDELGFTGIGLGASALGRSLDHPDFEEFWAELDRRSTTVFLHPSSTPDTLTTGMDSYFLAPKYGGPQEATVAATRLVVSGVTRRYPNISWIVSPMGGHLAYTWRRFEEMTEFLGEHALLEGDPWGELGKLYYDTSLTDDRDVVELFVRKFGTGRLVLGTDAPRLPVTDWMDRVRRCLAGQDEAARTAVFGGTLERLGLRPVGATG